MIQKIYSNIWKISFSKFGSYVYLIKLGDKNILIDTSSPENSDELLDDLRKLGLSQENIDTIIITHTHPDHIGGMLLFPNAKVYGNAEDSKKNIISIKKLNIPELIIVETPGHSKESICILYKDILFSGDTLFHRGTTGRTDLPGSSEKEMQESLKKIKKLRYKFLCPGHGSED
jgi:glyoxylase-like metal-dependent hydrolase (beta-lactamase superfamily II)